MAGRSYPYRLRSYRRIAAKDYGCCVRCEHPIFCGDEYLGEVLVLARGRLSVRRYHFECLFGDMTPGEMMRDAERARASSRPRARAIAA